MKWRPASLVFAGALAFLGANVAAAFAPLGNWHWTVTICLCVLEGGLVVLWWMDMLKSSALVRLYVVIPFFAVALLISLTLAEMYTRSYVDPPWSSPGLNSTP
jgi:caa(3)-type oxidase subunit IV